MILSDLITYCIMLYYTTLNYTILDYITLYHTILYYTILYYTILYYTILYCTVLYYTILYCTILYYRPMGCRQNTQNETLTVGKELYTGASHAHDLSENTCIPRCRKNHESVGHLMVSCNQGGPPADGLHANRNARGCKVLGSSTPRPQPAGGWELKACLLPGMGLIEPQRVRPLRVQGVTSNGQPVSNARIWDLSLRRSLGSHGHSQDIRWVLHADRTETGSPPRKSEAHKKNPESWQPANPQRRSGKTSQNHSSRTSLIAVRGLRPTGGLRLRKLKPPHVRPVQAWAGCRHLHVCNPNSSPSGY